MRNCVLFIAAILACPALARSAEPATRPAPGEAALQQLLKPTTPSEQPIAPILDSPKPDAKSGKGAVAPNAPTQNLVREGTYIPDRVGRLTRTADGQLEFTFESDAKTLADPPMIILPNQLLMQMEMAAQNANRDLKFRVTGRVTEYKARNYIMLEKVVVVPDSVQQH